MRSNDKFSTFLEIAKDLNAINIIPLLMGSVGLEVVTKRSWDASDYQASSKDSYRAENNNFKDFEKIH
ncbi:hypothetical protein [Sporosarcina sp. SAFN-015]|uniref:hypothetical protein n=1 Tax=Sporosarcina sp. SAFN-015 TaxID=3387274 RepID=UPI003F7F79CE